MDRIDKNVWPDSGSHMAETLGHKFKQEQSHISAAVKDIIQRRCFLFHHDFHREKFTLKAVLLGAMLITAHGVWAGGSENNCYFKNDYCGGQVGPAGPAGADGQDGDSAYQIALNNGFVGTEQEWLLSLQGADGIDGLNGKDGINGADGLDGQNGASAYQVAVNNGFEGSETQWLESLQGLQGLQGEQGIQGVKGDTGATGATGMQGEQGLQGLQGEQGIQGVKGDTGATGATGMQGVKGDTGTTGAMGYSAYQVAQVNGFDGTITEWLASLKGDTGNTGMTGASGFSAYQVAVGDGFDGTVTQWLASLKGADGTNGITKEVMDAADTYILNEAKTYVNQVGEQTLNQANAYTDSRVNALNRDMRKLEDRTYAAVASSIAIASLPQPTDAGYNMLSAGVGTWEGEQGYAFGLSGVTENNKYVYKVAVTTNSEGDFGAGAAIGWQWK